MESLQLGFKAQTYCCQIYEVLTIHLQNIAMHCRDYVVSLSSLRAESERIQHAEASKDWDDLEEQLEEEHRGRAGGNLSGAMAETKVGGQRLHACSCKVARFLSLFYPKAIMFFFETNFIQGGLLLWEPVHGG